MQYIKTGFRDLWILEPSIFFDSRGEFSETFNAKDFEEHTGLSPNFVQQNQSTSSKDVLRGMHLQYGDFEQAKLVRVVCGGILDVVVDLRSNEPTFGDYFSIELTGKNRKQLFVPRGMAHGFLALEENTIFAYSCDNFYNPDKAITLQFDDSEVAIQWPKNKGLKLSDKDSTGVDFKLAVELLKGEKVTIS